KCLILLSLYVGRSPRNNASRNTQGRPRKINHIAHYALICAAVGKASNVTADHVRIAREENTP
ncbi:MAG: hypothetical protein BECKG1743E_GA0114224_112172, partial [Candidatus Kentron sp. G]